jgi:hypothetical protein
VVEDIKIRRLEWADHIISMAEERIPKKVLNENIHTTIPVGRPRNRWADVVQRDALQLLGIRGWRRRAANRDEWRCLMMEAKARKGLYSHRWMDGWMACPVVQYFSVLSRQRHGFRKKTFFGHKTRVLIFSATFV